MRVSARDSKNVRTVDIIESTLIQNRTQTQASSDQVQNLSDIMDSQYWSAQDLIKKLNLSHKPTFRKKYPNPALQAGLLLLEYPDEYPDKPRSPKQKYKKVK